MSSGSDEFKSQVSQMSEDPIPYIRAIQRRLQKRTFSFGPQKAVLAKKSDGKKRPIVVSPIDNRVVQRAILNVLQSDVPKIQKMLGAIPSIIRTKTSVGGVPERGVSHGLALALDAIEPSKSYFLKSDVRDFFTQVPKGKVVKFVRANTDDLEFCSLFEQALETELQNEEEIKDYIHMFPMGDKGVPQGSSLSAFAGNVVLREFDQSLNGRGITTIRYIDDFVILGGSKKSVQKAFESAQEILGKMDMRAYLPEKDTAKAGIGKTEDGFSFLGCIIRNGQVSPAPGAVKKILEQVSRTLRSGEKAIDGFLADPKLVRRAEASFAETLTKVDRQVRGWGDSFAFCTQRLSFSQLDHKIDELVSAYVRRVLKKLRSSDSRQRRRALGIALLCDVPKKSMPHLGEKELLDK